MNDIIKKLSTADDQINKIEFLIGRYASNPTLYGQVIFAPKIIPPQFLFKYTSIDSAIKIIDSCSFRYTQQEVLDDIFEENPCREEIARILPGYEDGPTLLINTRHCKEDLIRLDKIKSMRYRELIQKFYIAPILLLFLRKHFLFSDCHQPFTEPRATPRIINFDRHKYTTINGIIAKPSII